MTGNQKNFSVVWETFIFTVNSEKKKAIFQYNFNAWVMLTMNTTLL